MSSETEKKLREEINRLKQKLDKVTKEKQRIEDEKQRIEKEFEEFKAKHNCTVENLKQAMHLKPNLYARKIGLGAKKGHKAYIRKMPERFDYVKESVLDNCPECNHKLPKDNYS